MLDDFLRCHDGVITTSHARSLGLSNDAVERRARSGHWRRCSPGVYFVDDRPFTDSARVRAAVWGHGPRAVGSGLAAAWWHGVTKYAPDAVEVTMPRNSHGRCHDGSRVRRRDLSPEDVVELRGLRVTAIEFAVVEAAVRRGGGGPKLMDSALQRHVELKPLWTAHLRNKGRHGSPAARMLLHAAEDGARSAAERLLIRLLNGAGITGWTANYPVAGYLVDAGFPAHRIAVETDGMAFHSDSDDFNNDRKRQNAIILAGWQVLRFTWLDLTEYPQRVIAEIRRALSARSSAATAD